MTTGTRPSEFSLIAQLFAPLARSPGAFGLTDDAATIAPPPGHELVVTADALIEGVHFLADDPADLIARKALRVNLSDLAAKGAQPLNYLLCLSLPKSVSLEWLRAFAAGLNKDQTEFGLSLLGGDTTATPGPLTIAITAFGSVPLGKMLRRSGARVGDSVFVTGSIGDAGAGLSLLKGTHPDLSILDRDFLIGRYRLPTPRLAFGHELIGLATASLDVSDGLIADLGHIAETSGVRLDIDAAALPVTDSDVVRAATAGDDYEIAFTAPSSAEPAMRAAASRQKLAVTRIGTVEAGEGVRLLARDGSDIPVLKPGFTHF